MPAKTQPIIQLVHADGEAKVLIETEQQDRFMLTLHAAIRACQAFSHMDEFTEQFTNLHAKVSAWVATQDHHVSKAFLTARDSAILLLLVQKSPSFDQELEDSLTDLDIEIAQDEEFNLIRLNILALPMASEDSINSFLVSGSANL